MPANTQPIFPKTPKITMGTVSTANTAKDGTGTNTTVAQANDAASGGNGLRLDSIKVRPLGTNVASVLRLFINNGGANSTPTNNSLFLEITLPATTLSEVAALSDISLKFDNIQYPQIVLPAGYKINATVGTAGAAGWQITSFGGEL